MSALDFDTSVIAIQVGYWRAALDHHRRGKPDTDATLKLDRLLSGFSRALRDDEPAVVIPATGASVLDNIGAAAQSIAEDAVQSLSEDCKHMYQLAALFRAISEARGAANVGPLDQVMVLADLGHYVANDYANSTDCVREDYAAELAKAGSP